VRSGNYQDNVTRPLSRDHDDSATTNVDPDMIDGDLDADTDADPIVVHTLVNFTSAKQCK
jgi:hypothetical protein